MVDEPEPPRQEPRGVARETTSLDLLMNLDEPEQLVLELERIATAKAPGSLAWGQVASYAGALIRALEKLNEPKPRE